MVDSKRDSPGYELRVGVTRDMQVQIFNYRLSLVTDEEKCNPMASKQW